MFSKFRGGSNYFCNAFRRWTIAAWIFFKTIHLFDIEAGPVDDGLVRVDVIPSHKTGSKVGGTNANPKTLDDNN